MNICGNCIHWENKKDQNGSYDMRYGVCICPKNWKPFIKNSIWFETDSHEPQKDKIDTNVYTGPEYGCVNWEEGDRWRLK